MVHETWYKLFSGACCTTYTQRNASIRRERLQIFDVCCVATGAGPVLPEGLRDSRVGDVVYVLRDTDSVETLKNRFRGVRRAVVVGAGGIAMEVVHELVDCQVFWVVKGHIGGSFFDARLGALISEAGDVVLGERKYGDFQHVDAGESVTGSGVGPDWLEERKGPLLVEKNCEMKSNTSEGRLRGGGGGKAVRVMNGEVRKVSLDKSGGVDVQISDGTSICCDIIIVRAGVTPNSEWLSLSGLQLAGDGGVVTKCGRMETSTPNVYAAGDCTHMIQGGENWSQMRGWSQAFVGGRAAGREMGRCAGGEGYEGLEFEVFEHATKFFGKRVVLLGRFVGGERGKVYERVDDNDIVRVFVVDGRVRGAVLVGILGERIAEKDLELNEFFD